MERKIELIPETPGVQHNCTLGNRCTRRGVYILTAGNETKNACRSHARKYAERHNLKIPRDDETHE